MSLPIQPAGVGAYLNALRKMDDTEQKNAALKAYNEIKDYSGRYVKVDPKNPGQIKKMGSTLEGMGAGAQRALGMGQDIADTKVLKKILAGRLEQLGVEVPLDAPKHQQTAGKAHETGKAQVVRTNEQEAAAKAAVAHNAKTEQLRSGGAQKPKTQGAWGLFSLKSTPEAATAKKAATTPKPEKAAPKNVAQEAAKEFVNKTSNKGIVQLDQFLKVNPGTYVRYVEGQKKLVVLTTTERAAESARRLAGKGSANVYEAKFLREAVDEKIKSIPNDEKKSYLMHKPSGENVNRMEVRAQERTSKMKEKVEKYPQAVKDYQLMLGSMGDKWIPGLAEQFKNYTGTYVRINPTEADDVKPLSTFEAAKETALRAAGKGNPNVIDAKLFKEVLEERMNEVSQEGFEAYEDAKPAAPAEKPKGGGIFGRKKPGDTEMDVAAAHPKRNAKIQEEEYMELKEHVDTADVIRKREEGFKKRELLGTGKDSFQFENVDKSKNSRDVTARPFKPRTGTSEDLFGDKEPAGAESPPEVVGRSASRSDVRQMDEKSRMKVGRQTLSASEFEKGVEESRKQKATAPVASTPKTSEGIATRFSFQVKDVKKPKVMHKVECKIHLDGDAKTVKHGENLQTNFMKHVKEHLAKDIGALPADMTPQEQVDAGKNLIAGYRKLIEENVLGGGLITGQVVLELPNGRTLTLNLNKDHTISETATPLGSVDL